MLHSPCVLSAVAASVVKDMEKSCLSMASFQLLPTTNKYQSVSKNPTPNIVFGRVTLPITKYYFLKFVIKLKKYTR